MIYIYIYNYLESVGLSRAVSRSNALHHHGGRGAATYVYTSRAFYFPSVKVFADAHEDGQCIALNRVQMGYGVDVLARLDALQTDNPDGREM